MPWAAFSIGLVDRSAGGLRDFAQELQGQVDVGRAGPAGLGGELGQRGAAGGEGFADFGWDFDGDEGSHGSSLSVSPAAIISLMKRAWIGIVAFGLLLSCSAHRRPAPGLERLYSVMGLWELAAAPAAGADSVLVTLDRDGGVPSPWLIPLDGGAARRLGLSDGLTTWSVALLPGGDGALVRRDGGGDELSGLLLARRGRFACARSGRPGRMSRILRVGGATGWLFSWPPTRPKRPASISTRWPCLRSSGAWLPLCRPGSSSRWWRLRGGSLCFRT